MKATAFERGMYYPMLANVADDVRFRLVPIELKCCSNCGTEYERGFRCSKCGTAFDPETMRRGMDMRLMWCGLDASDAATMGVSVPLYAPEGRVHCNYELDAFTCDNYFTISEHAIDQHRYCANGHELPPPPNVSSVFAKALHYERVTRRPCPECGFLAGPDRNQQNVVPPVPWCPSCRVNSRIPPALGLPPTLTTLWVFRTVSGIALDTSLSDALEAEISLACGLDVRS